MPLTTPLRNAMLSAINTQLNGGSLELYTASFTTLLATFTLPSPAFGTPSNGSMGANAIAAVNAVATGAAESWRLKSSGGAVQWEDDTADAISESTGTGIIKLNQANTNITQGQQVSISSWTISQPA